MNKYKVKIPYYYNMYGDKIGYVYAADEEEAEELANEDYLEDGDYYDHSEPGDTEYNYDEITVELEEEDVPEHLVPERDTYPESNSFNVPSASFNSAFLEDLPHLPKAA